MSRFGQVGIALAALGMIITLMGLFPGVTGIEETPSIGVVQVFMLLMGYALFVFGGMIYVKFTFYWGQKSNLVQQIGIRLTLTGLIFAAVTGMADILGFGSHIRTGSTDIFFGGLQGIGTIFSLSLSCIGVLIYVIAGNPQMSEEALEDDLSTKPPRATNELKALTEENRESPPSSES